MAGPRVVRCDLCRQRHKRCNHILLQPAAPPRRTAAVPGRPKKSLVTRLPVKIMFTGNRAGLVSQPSPAAPHPATHLSSHPVGPPPLRPSSTSCDAVVEDASNTPAGVATLPRIVSTTETGFAIENRDFNMLDVGATSLQPQGNVPIRHAELISDEEGVERGRADSVTTPQVADVPGTKYTCDLCRKPIVSKVWSSCRACDNVDFHKACVQEGRRIHHIKYPRHGFMQVAREGDEDEDLLGDWLPGPLQEEDTDVYICDACDQPIDGMRHYCTDCPDLDFCDEHFISGIKEHQSSKPDHIFDHKQVPRDAKSGAVTNTAGTRRARGRRDNTPVTTNYLVDPEPSRGNQTVSEAIMESSRRGPPSVEDDGPYHPAPAPHGTTTPTSLPRPVRRSGKQAPAPGRRRGGKAPDSSSSHKDPTLPQPRTEPSYFSSITEQIAKHTPSRPGRHKMYPVERATREAFAKKWLFHFHSYIRTWSDEANVAHAIDGLQMVSDFSADAALNDFMTAHFSHVTGVDIAGRNRDYHFTNPFQAASKARRLNQLSIENWRMFRDRDGMIAGQVVATMGCVQLQEVDALLSRARESGLR